MEFSENVCHALMNLEKWPKTPCVSVINSFSCTDWCCSKVSKSKSKTSTNLSWQIFVCYLVGVYIWPFPSKCVTENNHLSLSSQQKKVCFEEKVPHHVSLPSAAHHRLPALHEGMHAVYVAMWMNTQLLLEHRNEKWCVLLLSSCQTVVEPLRKAEEVSDESLKGQFK